ncbi:oligosaccharide flippase family protein [Acinetobacter baumannii]|uniref:Wzx n=1 Tax=Acinetobacter baumannii TaxID=470 RepID=A0A6B9QHN7_ACIBA|nr:oligosaccharide flippase family protein [Acinetobacter baumannii]MDV7525637.1 oligosaccharide flippase family protein [Acinetobacter baumannii]MDV7599270.1 oligosaccharide flippase family protein [Acinetobacter baumannii]QHE90304.1 Wzx [Acinetobacter baumannii]HEI9752015.1 oligosaccharide flippase family protein [Acinetobacter baumannii]
MSKAINKEVFYLYIIQIANMVIPLLSFSYMANILGLVGFGQVSFYQTVSFLAAFFIDFGFNMSAAQKMSISLDDKSKMDELYSNVQSIKFFIFLVVSVLGGLSILFLPLSHIDATLLFIGILSAFSTILLSGWVFQGLGRNSVLAFFSVVGRVVSVGLIFLLIHQKSDVLLAVIIQVAISFSIGLAAIIYFYRKNVVTFRIKTISIFKMRQLSEDSYHNFTASLFTLGFTYLNPLVVKFCFGDAFLGLYALADKLAVILKQFFTPVTQAYYSRMCILSHEKKYQELIQNAKKVAIFFATISTLAFFGNLLIGNYIYNFLFGPEYKIVSLLSIMIMTQFIVSMAMVLVNLIIIPTENSRILKKYYLIGLIFHFGYFYFFVKYLHIYGVASAILLTETILTLSFFMYVRKYFSKVLT